MDSLAIGGRWAPAGDFVYRGRTRAPVEAKVVGRLQRCQHTVQCADCDLSHGAMRAAEVPPAEDKTRMSCRRGCAQWDLCLRMQKAVLDLPLGFQSEREGCLKVVAIGNWSEVATQSFWSTSKAYDRPTLKKLIYHEPSCRDERSPRWVCYLSELLERFSAERDAQAVSEQQCTKSGLIVLCARTETTIASIAHVIHHHFTLYRYFVGSGSGTGTAHRSDLTPNGFKGLAPKRRQIP